MSRSSYDGRTHAGRGTRCLLLACCLASVLLATAQSAWAQSRWYQVEVIVFRYAQASATEHMPPLRTLPDYRGALSLVTDLPDFSDEPRPNEVVLPGPVAFQALPRQDLLMGGVYQRLRALAEYEPVLHAGWRQPGVATGRTRRVYLTDKPGAGADVPLESEAIGVAPASAWFEGAVEVRTGRLLHVDVDFVNHVSGETARINERRKVKFKELHYFDNPRFGVLVQVTPYRVDVADDDAAAD